MRTLSGHLVVGLTCSLFFLGGCKDGDKDGDKDGEGGFPPGLDSVLKGVTGYETDVDASFEDATCEGDTWTFEVSSSSFFADPADEIALATWDVATNTFAGGWNLDRTGSEDEDVFFGGTVGVSDAGVPCDGPTSMVFLAFPIVGDRAGSPDGSGGHGASYGGGMSAGGPDSKAEVSIYADDTADAGSWRLTDIFEKGATRSGALEDQQDGTYGATLDEDFVSTDTDPAPVLGMWLTAGGEPVGAMAL